MKPSPAQRQALESCVKHGSPTYHLRGMSAWGGWGGTREALLRRGWLDTGLKITAAGRQAIGLPGDLGGGLAESADD